MSMITVKVTFEKKKETRRFNFDTTNSYDLLEQTISQIFGFSTEFDLLYQDEEGDWIHMSSNNELKHAIDTLTINSTAKILKLNMKPRNRKWKEKNSNNLTEDQNTSEQMRNISIDDNRTNSFNHSPLPDENKDCYKCKQPGHYVSNCPVPSRGRGRGRGRGRENGESWRRRDPSTRVNKSKSRFVKHVTIPDDSLFNPDTKFVKTWKFRNEGAVSWPESTGLLFISKRQDQMEGPDFVPLQKIVEPGEEIDVSVDLVAPKYEGIYNGYWKLAENEEGPKFGQRVRVKIQVLDTSEEFQY